MKRIRQILDNFLLRFINVLFYFNLPLYMRQVVSYYKRRGMQIEGTPNYISNNVYFDGTDYSLISIGEGVTISMGVSILTHDGSIRTIYIDMPEIKAISNDSLLEWHKKDMCRLRGEVTIGAHSFVGAKAFLLPGTEIGRHCIIGAGSVVKGKIPDFSVAYGNPAKIHGDTRNLVNKRLEQYDIERGGAFEKME